MNSIPPAAEPLIHEFAGAFTRPTFQRFVILLFAAILTLGRRTVTNLLRTVDALAPGHPSSYHRVFSKRRWSSWRLARALAGFILRTWVPEGPVRLAGDDTVDEHRGKKLAAPAQVVERSPRSRLTVAWYGGGTRRVEAVSGTDHWYKNGKGLVPIHWVFVHDCDGTHRDEYFFTTDPGLTPRMIIETFTSRWSIETTFQEMRAYLGLETTRGRTEKTVLRTAPCLFGLFSVIVLLYAQLPARRVHGVGVLWPGKTERTFSDAITAVRRWLWSDWVFATPKHHGAFAKLSRPIRAVLLYALAPAA